MNRSPNDEVCKVCESTEGYDRVFERLDKCRSCGFITFHGSSQDAPSSLYDEDYFAGGEYPDYLGQQDALRRSMRRHLKQMARYHPNRGSLLEVGSAYGLFLDEAKGHFESVAGIDICEGPTAYARERLGLNVECREFEERDFGSNRVDIVCFWDTVEHLAAPEVYLKKCATLLNKDGMVFLTTGDIGSLNARFRRARWRQIHPPSHLHYFSRVTITRLFNRLGFEVVGIETTSYYHTLFNVLASIRLREGLGGWLASTALRMIRENPARRLGFWINLGDIMFVAARLKNSASDQSNTSEPGSEGTSGNSSLLAEF